MMKEQFTVYTARNGERYIQTKSKYLAHALAFLGFRFMMFDKMFSFKYTEQLEEALNKLMELQKL